MTDLISDEYNHAVDFSVISFLVINTRILAALIPVFMSL